MDQETEVGHPVAAHEEDEEEVEAEEDGGSGRNSLAAFGKTISAEDQKQDQGQMSPLEKGVEVKKAFPERRPPRIHLGIIAVGEKAVAIVEKTPEEVGEVRDQKPEQVFPIARQRPLSVPDQDQETGEDQGGKDQEALGPGEGRRHRDRHRGVAPALTKTEAEKSQENFERKERGFEAGDGPEELRQVDGQEQDRGQVQEMGGIRLGIGSGPSVQE